MFLVRRGKFDYLGIQAMVPGERIWFVNKLVDDLKKEKEEHDKARAEMEQKMRSKSSAARPRVGRRR